MIADLAEQHHKLAALHPDLISHLRDGPVRKIIHRPLLVSVTTIPGYHKADNTRYRHRRDGVAQSWRDRDFSNYIALHERRYGAEAIQRVLSMTDLLVDPPATWKLIKAAWIDRENVDEYDLFLTRSTALFLFFIGARPQRPKCPSAASLPTSGTTCLRPPIRGLP